MRSAAFWGGWVLLGLALAMFTTGGTLGVPPTTLGVVSAFGVVGLLSALAAWEGPPRLRVALSLIALVALGFVGGQDALRPGVAHSHDLRYHLWAMYSTWRCVLDGDLWPRWDPYLALGIPLLQFYGPLNYVPGWPFQALGASPVQALAGVLVVGQIGAAWSAWLACRWLGRSHAASLLAAGLLVLAPYRFLDMTFRLALGEYLAMGLVPLLLVAAWKVARGDRGLAPWVLGLVTATCLLTHVLTILMVVIVGAVPILSVLFGTRGRTAPRSQAVATLGLAAALTVGATAAWWLPMITEQANTSITHVISSDQGVARYAAAPQEVITRWKWRRYDVRYKLRGKRDAGKAMPLYFGCVLLALLGVSLATGREDEDAPSPRWFAVPALAALILATDPGARVLDLVPMGKLQFPWRFYSLATVGTCMAAAAALDVRAKGRVGAALVALTLTAACIDAVPYFGAQARYEPYEGVSNHTGRRARPYDLPKDTFLRVEQLALPPADASAYRVAKSRVMFTEYMNNDLREIFGLYRRIPEVEESEWSGASVRFGSSRPTVFDPDPLVALRVGNGSFTGQPHATWDIQPERITVDLPTGLPGGDLRFTSNWFDGWEASVDGGPWVLAGISEGLLTTPIPPGARQVVFRYSMTTPWDRPVGLGLSIVSLLSLGAIGWRTRRSK